MASSLAEKFAPAKAGLTSEEVKAIIENALKNVNSQLNKLTMIISTVDNKLSSIKAMLDNNKATTTMVKPAETKVTTPVIAGKYEIPASVSKLLKSVTDFQTVTDMVYHPAISYSTFKNSFTEKAKELGKDIRGIIPSLKSKEVWALIETHWGSATATAKKPALVDKTEAITLSETLQDAGINLERLNKGLKQFEPVVDAEMFTDSKYLTLDNYRYILSQLGITIRDTAPCNTDAQLRKYISELMYNAMIKRQA